MIYAKYWRYAVPTLTGIVTDNLSWIKVAVEKSKKGNAITFHESIDPCNTTMRLFGLHGLSAEVFPFSQRKSAGDIMPWWLFLVIPAVRMR